MTVPQLGSCCSRHTRHTGAAAVPLPGGCHCLFHFLTPANACSRVSGQGAGDHKPPGNVGYPPQHPFPRPPPHVCEVVGMTGVLVQ